MAFFATSNCKSSCDGIGGTIKRLAANASLQRPIKEQILTPKQLFLYADSEIKGVTCFYISKEELEKNRAMLEHRFSKCKTIPGTHSFHCVIASKYGLSFSKLSGEPSLYPLSVQRKGNEISTDDVPVTSYVSCLYEKEWYVGMVEKVSVEENDALVKFLHPNGPSVYFHWPAVEDKCWVPVEHILQLLSIPSVSTSGRHYTFTERELKDTKKQFVENI